MIALVLSLVTMLGPEEASADRKCEPTDNRCKAELFVSRAKKAPTAELRAQYLHAAHRSYLFLYDQTGEARDLCAARRVFEQGLAVEGVSNAQRAAFDATQKDLTSRERAAGGRCAGTAKRPQRKEPPVVAAKHAMKEPPITAATAPSSEIQPEVTADAPAGSPPDVRPLAPHVAMLEPHTAGPADVDSLLPVPRAPAAPRRSAREEEPRAGRGLVIAGGVGLGVGLALSGVAGFLGGRLVETVDEARVLKGQVNEYATDDQLAADAALMQEYRRLGPPTLALALAGGSTLVVSAVLLGVGGRRMARAASQTALVPVPGGLAFRARF
jgi:hypothetical protein